MLAALPAAQVRALFPDPTPSSTGTGPGPRSLSALRRVLVEVRAHG